jgi:MFS family permease
MSRRVITAAFLRATAVGTVGVFLAIALADRGLSLSTIGLIIGAGMACGAVATALVGARVDQRVGRRRLLVVFALLGALGLAAMAAPLPPAALVVAAFLGMVNGMGRDRGGLGTLEQAILPDTAPPERRTWALAYYNLTLDIGHATGALAGALPALLVAWLAMRPRSAYDAMLIAAAFALLAGALLYARLPPDADASAARSLPPIGADSKRRVRRLSALFFIDSFGGGFLSSALVAYFFFARFGFSEPAIAVLFVAARGLNALSHLGAAWLADRIGLVNTMVFTHLPSSLFLMAAPSAPSAGLAAALFLAREGLVEMDVPTRQSFVLSIVRPDERTYASGVTNLTRTLGWAAGPMVAGAMMQYVSPAAPLYIGGALKIGYDLWLYREARATSASVRP